MPWQPWDDGPPQSRPRRVKGGIRAQSARGRFAESWWGARWINVLEALDLGGRLGRGRSYARAGQVLDIHIDKGVVRSRVQGSRPDPYDVTINVKPLPAAGWKKVAAVLSARAAFAARLLAGEMPQDIEQAFEAAGTSLFPASYRDLRTQCSCPDDSNPCKHIAAVYYLLGEEFDRDPFLIFRLRGCSREELITWLRAGAGDALQDASAEPETVSPAVWQLSADPARFWHAPAAPAPSAVETAPMTAPDAVLQRLGRFPFWRGEMSLSAVLGPLYRDASARGLAALVEGAEKV